MGYSRKKWMGIAGALVVSGLLFIAGLGSPGAQAQGNPLSEILDKLNQVLAAINGAQQNNSTLRWDQNLPAAQRFVILAAFNDQAVLDKNTGLVWEKSPDDGPEIWSLARRTCADKIVGGQKGWRLPSFVELSSLVDPTAPRTGPTLAPGHPFLNVQTEPFYWSATTNEELPARVWGVHFLGADVLHDLQKTGGPNLLWCVRGGMNADKY